MKKMMKTLSILLVVVMMVCFTTACGKEEDALTKIKDKGVITVATSPDFPPFESIENGEIVGIEVEIMQLVAADLGVEVKFEQMDFDSVLPGIQAGKFDVGVSGITVTEERTKNADFTTPYFLASQVIVVTADSPIATKADLAGKKVSVQTGTTAESYCMENGYEVLGFQANNDAATALTTGKVDAWVVDNEVAVAICADLEGVVVLEEAMTSEPYAFAFAKGSETLTEAINEILVKYIKDGTIEGIFTKYGVTYVAPQL